MADTRKPPKLATALLRMFGADSALAGDLAEGYALGKSRWWLWRQTLAAMLLGTHMNKRLSNRETEAETMLQRFFSSVAAGSLLVIAVLILSALGWIGVSGAFKQFSECHTIGQFAQTLAQFAFGPLALLAIVTTFGVRGWNAVVLRLWVATVAVAGGLAPVVWDNDTSFAVGLVAGAAAFFVGWATAAALRVGGRAVTNA